MFGRQDDQSTPADQVSADQNSQAPGTPDQQPDPVWQHPGEPMHQPVEENQAADIISPAGGFPKAPSFTPGGMELDDLDDLALESVAPAGEPAPANDQTTQELTDIKQHALTELLPLIDKLDLSPADRFKTLLMMIQASDDPHLIKAAYESAHKIEDEKVRAQALLDIVNEINYFTQPTPKA
jgi:hypothetical protein